MTDRWDRFPYWRGAYRHSTGWRLSVEQTDFLGRRIPAYAHEWTPDMRRQGIEVLRAVKHKDQQVLAALQELV